MCRSGSASWAMEGGMMAASHSRPFRPARTWRLSSRHEKQVSRGRIRLQLALAVLLCGVFLMERGGSPASQSWRCLVGSQQRPGLHVISRHSSQLTCRAEGEKKAAPALRPGSRAILRGLESKPELNGNPVEVVRWDIEREVWIVQMGGADDDDRPSFNVLPENLEPSFAQAKIGSLKEGSPQTADDKEFNPVAFLGAIIAVVVAVPTVLFTVVPLGVFLVKAIVGDFSEE
mmetsp:Transcript_28626/g.52091  ORF Transcript_28626/g.52091 Transcript_28626/m.52091 type:complete len:231 (+) Transcript_28626:30-722(+)